MGLDNRQQDLEMRKLVLLWPVNRVLPVENVKTYKIEGER